LGIFKVPAEEIKVSIKPNKNNGYCTWRQIYDSDHISFRLGNASDKFVEEIKTHILCSKTFFRKSCRLWDLLTYSMEQSPSWEANWFCS
jgi:hypothetical protein